MDGFRKVCASKEDKRPDPPDALFTARNLCEEERLYILEVLDEVTGNFASGVAGDECTKALQNTYSALDSRGLFRASVLCDPVLKAPGQQMQKLLRAVNVLGEIRDSQRTTLGVSGAFVCLLLNYFRPFVDENVFRRGVALYSYAFQGNARNIEPMAAMLGCGKHLIYDGRNEISTSGLHFDDDAVESKAGRPDVHTTFAEYTTAIGMAAGLTPEQLLDRQNYSEVLETVAGIDVDKIVPDINDSTRTDGTSADKSKPNEETEKSGHDEIVEPVEDLRKDFTQILTTAKNGTSLLSTYIEFVNAHGKFGNLNIVKELAELAEAEVKKCEEAFQQLPDENDTQAKPDTDPKEEDTSAGRDTKGDEKEFQDVGESEQSAGKAPTESANGFEETYRNMQFTILIGMLGMVDEICHLLTENLSHCAPDAKSIYYAVKKICKKWRTAKAASNAFDSKWHSYQWLTDMKKTLMDEKVQDTHSQQDNVQGKKEKEAYRWQSRQKARSKEVVQFLRTLTKRIESYGNNMAGGLAKQVKSSVQYLCTLQDMFALVISQNPWDGDENVRAAFSILTEILLQTARKWMDCWKCHNKSSAVSNICHLIQAKATSVVMTTCFEDYFQSVEAYNEKCIRSCVSDQEYIHQEGNPGLSEQEESGGNVHDAMIDEMIAKTNQTVHETETLLENLKNHLLVVAERLQNRKNSHTEDFAEAVAFLTEIGDRFVNTVKDVGNSHDLCTWSALDVLAVTMCTTLKNWLENLGPTENEKAVLCSAARKVSKSILCQTKKNHLEKAWKLFNLSIRRTNGDEDARNDPGRMMIYKEAESVEEVAHMFEKGFRLSSARKLELIRKFWDEGKDPTDIRVWLQYIIDTEYERNYGDASSTHKCCRITRNELSIAISFLSGFTCSPNTAFDIVTKQMGYSLRQCAKLDQVGAAHPLRNRQYMHIQDMLKNADRNTTLILSIDSKAFIVLGKLKHDNGVLLSSPDGKVYRVFDHDFPFTMSQIYPEGTKYVDASRMNEKAVLRPVGALCLNDNDAYVSMVLGKDTAESMCNLITEIVRRKRSTTMPNLERVLLLADGGGANMSNGITWKDELLCLANRVHVSIDVCHFSAGSSKHNPVEHRLWAYCSIHCKGKPMLDIEHVLRYFNETTTSKGLKVSCWFDPRRYLTNAEKKALGKHVLTRHELEAKAKGRISHTYNEDNDMYKWNYTVLPSYRADNSQDAA